MSPDLASNALLQLWENNYLATIQDIYQQLRQRSQQSAHAYRNPWMLPEENHQRLLDSLIANPNIFMARSIPETLRRLSLSPDNLPDELVLSLLKNPNIPWDLATRLKDMITDDFLRIMSWNKLSSHPGLTWNFLREHTHYPWDWYQLSKHPNITLEMIHSSWQLIDVNWNWRGIAENPNVSIKDLERYSPEPESRQHLIYSPRLTWQDIVQRGILSPWDWRELSKSPAITWDIVQEHPEIIWDWTNLSENPNIDPEFILATLNTYPWEWQGILKNPNLTWEIIRRHPRPEWVSLDTLRNPMTGGFYRWKVRAQQAIRTIHRLWKRVAWNPEFSFAQKRLLTIHAE
jgi:hypothetical protein